MATITYNPYPEIGQQLTKGLEAIASALTPTSTVDDFVNEIYKFIQPIYYPAPVSKQLEIEIKSVAYNMINAYNNKTLNYNILYGPIQSNIIEMMLGSTTTDHTPINALKSWFLDIEDNITKSNLSIEAQTPLLLTTTCANNLYDYLVAKVATPGVWASFFQTPAALNYANIPFWTAACMEGVLIGANATQKGLIAPTTDIVSVDIISALIGGLAIGGGKIIFKWVPRIQPQQLSTKLSLDKEVIATLANSSAGMAGMRPLSIFHWVDCGAHSPHWCNTVCAGGGGKKSRNVDGDADAEVCGGAMAPQNN